MELGYQIWSTAPALPPMILLHGMGGTGALWRPIAASLESHYRLIAPDQRGHGGSQTPQTSYTPQDFGQDVLDTMAITRSHPAWIVGHSMGARTAAAAAWLRPTWVKGIVLIDIGFSGPAGGGMGDNLYQFLSILPLQFGSRTEARDFMSARCPDPSMGQYLMAVARMHGDGSLTFPFDRDALLRTLEGVRDSSIRPWLRELGARGMPVLALRGGDSRVWSKADFDEERRQFADYPSIRFEEVPGTGHGLPFEKRKEFVELLLKWTDSPAG